MIRRFSFVVLLFLSLCTSALSNEIDDLAKRAESGDAIAQSDLGLLYAIGKDVPQDNKRALYWYDLAANQGHALAQRNLGMAYFHGLGVPQNYKQAYIWLSLAAANGNRVFAFNRNSAASRLTPADLTEAQTEAAALSKKISERMPSK